jgi:hypothetical protein
MSFALIVLSTIPFEVKANQVGEYKSPSDIPLVLVEAMRNRKYEEQYVSHVLQIIRQNSSNGIELTQADLDKIKERKKRS